MVLAIVDETDPFIHPVSVHCQLDCPTLQAVGILDGYLVRRGSKAILDREFLPACGDTGLDVQHVAALLESEDGLEGDPIHPARRACVPCPPAAPEMSFRRIYIRRNDVRLDLVDINRRRILGVRYRVDHLKELERPISVTLQCCREHGP